VAGKPSREDEFEELSSSLIQMDTPAPEEITPAPILGDDSSTFEITEEEGESTSITPSLFSTKTDPSLTPLEHAEPARAAPAGYAEQEAEYQPDTSPPHVDTDQLVAEEGAPEALAPDEYTVPTRIAGGEESAWAAMYGELEQIDFFIEQGLPDDARALLEDV